MRKTPLSHRVEDLHSRKSLVQPLKDLCVYEESPELLPAIVTQPVQSNFVTHLIEAKTRRRQMPQRLLNVTKDFQFTVSQ